MIGVILLWFLGITLYGMIGAAAVGIGCRYFDMDPDYDVGAAFMLGCLWPLALALTVPFGIWFGVYWLVAESTPWSSWKSYVAKKSQ